MTSLAGHRVIVMGGTSGIGLAAAKQLVAEGARVTVAGRNPTKIAALRTEIPELAAEAVDASSSELLRSFFERHAPIDDLILTVSGGTGAGPFPELDLAALMKGIDDKLLTQTRSVQLALPFLAQRASVTFVSAISARAASPGTVGLAAINGAIEAMVKPLAKELKPVRVNAVSPGVIETPWWDRVPAEKRQQMLTQYAEASLVGRNGTADDVAEAILLLVRKSFMTGTVVEVDGGLHLG